MRYAYAIFAGFIAGLVLGYLHADMKHAAAVERTTALYEGQRENNRQAWGLLGQASEMLADHDAAPLVNRAAILIAIHPDVKLP